MSSDADLLRGASGSDRESVAALYDRHAGRMYAVALRIAGEAEEAAAVLEQVFGSLCDGTASFEGQGSVAAWLIRLTRDRALGRIAARQAQSVRWSVYPDGALTPRALVEAAFFGGLSVKEVAERLQATEETVRMKLKEGMVELRAQLR
jgi:RNA polymerase sigma-70 factor (ECF subfamily)